MMTEANPGSVRRVLVNAEPEPIDINLQSTAVMVIDMQNAFLSKGGFFDLLGIDTSEGRQVIGPIKEICT